MNYSILIYIFFAFLAFSSCTDSIRSDHDFGGNGVGANFSDIQSKVFSNGCANSGCHDGGGFSIPPNLKADVSYENLVNAQSPMTGDLYVIPGNSDESYLMKKLLGTASGSRMPIGADPLSKAITDSIAKWIDDGALNN